MSAGSCLVSVHDVMPDTLGRVDELVAVAAREGLDRLTLLVVPGREWSPQALDHLHRYQDAGHRLAGHGWIHHCSRIRGWRHSLHSMVLSRDVAEHLAASPEEGAQIVERCADWFTAHGFEAPRLYVPPAWALGDTPREAFAPLPFDLVETLTGVWDTHSNAFHRLPLVGFEADNLARQIVLRCSNHLNCLAARWRSRPLRVSLHPDDLRLRLQDKIPSFLRRLGKPLFYEDVRNA